MFRSHSERFLLTKDWPQAGKDRVVCQHGADGEPPLCALCVQFHFDSAGRSSPTFKSAVRFFYWIVRNSLITVFLLLISVEFLCWVVEFYVLLGLHDIRKNWHWACDVYCEKTKEISPHTCSVIFTYRCTVNHNFQHFGYFKKMTIF